MNGSIVCHLGEVHLKDKAKGQILKYLNLSNEKNLVDMSAVIIHPGHVRIINKAKRYGKVYIALTTDKEIKKKNKSRVKLLPEKRNPYVFKEC